MTSRRVLSLKREALTCLTSVELGAVHGGALPTTPFGECVATLPVRTVNVTDCVAISDAPSCLDCATRAC